MGKPNHKSIAKYIKKCIQIQLFRKLINLINNNKKRFKENKNKIKKKKKMFMDNYL